MTNQETAKTATKTNLSTTNIQKGIESHRKTAMHLEEAARNHHEAAKQHEAGNHEQAFHNTIKAQGHLALAQDTMREDFKQHALTK